MNGTAKGDAPPAAMPLAVYPPISTAAYTLAVLTASWVLAYLDRQIIVMLVEPLRRDLSLSDTQVSLLQGFAFSLFFVAAGLPLGRLVDRFNRRNILLLGMICWSVATFACGLATDFWQLFAARIGVGVGEACLAPAAVSLVADLIAPHRRGAAMGLVSAGAPLGTAGSFLLSGLILADLRRLWASDGSAVGRDRQLAVRVFRPGVARPAAGFAAAADGSRALTP